MLGLTEEELDAFVMQCKKGYSNTKERGTAVKNPAPLNVPIKMRDRSCINLLCLHYETFGQKGTSDARHFSFGDIEAPCGHTKQIISFARQQELIQWVVGTHSYFRGSTKSKQEAKEREVM